MHRNVYVYLYITNVVHIMYLCIWILCICILTPFASYLPPLFLSLLLLVSFLPPFSYCKGNVDSGKSTLIGVLTNATLDDGRGGMKDIYM